MVTERDVKDVLGRYYQHVGTDVIVGVRVALASFQKYI